jgi:hypothetical protein
VILINGEPLSLDSLVIPGGELCKLIALPGDPDESLDQAKAAEVLRRLHSHYPGHPWRVDFQGRALVIRHEDITLVMRYYGCDGVGRVLKHIDSYSATHLADEAMRHGGEMLEQFGLPRACWGQNVPVPDPVILKDMQIARGKYLRHRNPSEQLLRSLFQ